MAEDVTADLLARTLPVPLRDLAGLLSINVVERPLDGCAGLLMRLPGQDAAIIVIRQSDDVRRRRFTLAHELAHAMLGHPLVGRRSEREEAEADVLAGCLVAPSWSLLSEVAARRLQPWDVLRAARRLGVSVDVAGRRLVERRAEPLAVVVIREGIVSACFRDRSRFPFISIAVGDPVPAGSFALNTNEAGRSSREVDPLVWLARASPQGSRIEERVLRMGEASSLVVLHARPAVLSQPTASPDRS